MVVGWDADMQLHKLTCRAAPYGSVNVAACYPVRAHGCNRQHTPPGCMVRHAAIMVLLAAKQHLLPPCTPHLQHDVAESWTNGNVLQQPLDVILHRTTEQLIRQGHL